VRQFGTTTTDPTALEVALIGLLED
jgi:hypothetical protein